MLPPSSRISLEGHYIPYRLLPETSWGLCRKTPPEMEHEPFPSSFLAFFGGPLHTSLILFEQKINIFSSYFGRLKMKFCSVSPVFKN